MAPLYRLRKTLDAALDKRYNQPEFPNPIEAEEIEMATQVRAEASAHCQVRSSTRSDSKGTSRLLTLISHSTRVYTNFATVFIPRNRTVYTEDEKKYLIVSVW